MTLKTREELVIDMLAETIGHRTSHAFSKHVLGQGNKDHGNEFINSKFGPVIPVHSPEDLQNHIRMVLTSPDTQTIHTGGTTVYNYHEPSNTMVVLNTYGRSKEDGGSLFRIFPEVLAKEGWLSDRLEMDAKIHGKTYFQINPGGLLKHLQENPELTEKLEHRYKFLHDKKKSLDALEVQVPIGEIERNPSKFTSMTPVPRVDATIMAKQKRPSQNDPNFTIQVSKRSLQ